MEVETQIIGNQIETTARDRFLAGEPFKLDNPNLIYKYMPAPCVDSDPILIYKETCRKVLSGFFRIFNVSDEGYEEEVEAYSGGPKFRHDIYFENLNFASDVEQASFSRAISAGLIGAMTIFLSPESLAPSL